MRALVYEQGVQIVVITSLEYPGLNESTLELFASYKVPPSTTRLTVPPTTPSVLTLARSSSTNNWHSSTHQPVAPLPPTTTTTAIKPKLDASVQLILYIIAEFFVLQV